MNTIGDIFTIPDAVHQGDFVLRLTEGLQANKRRQTLQQYVVTPQLVQSFKQALSLIGSAVNGKKIFSPDKLGNLCRRLNIRIGIITVPANQAQSVCDLMVAGGIRAIWNFSPANLTAPAKVVIKNESLVASFVVLSQMLAQSFTAHGLD